MKGSDNTAKPDGRKNAPSAKSPIKSNVKQTKLTEIKPIENHRDKFYCSVCGQEFDKQRDNFPASQSPLYAGNNYYLDICNNCIDSLVDQYTEILGTEEKAIERICSKYDIYYNESLLNSSKKISQHRSRIKAYISKANLVQYKGRTYDTTLKERESDAITSVEDLEEAKNDKNINLPKNSVKFWGFGFSPEEYEFLNNQYAEWKTKCVVTGKAREGLVKDLCNIELHKRKALQDENIELYDKLTKTYQTVLSNANLSPKQEDESDKAGEKPIGVMIDMFENDRPIPEPLDEWKDVDGIIKMFSIYFLGHLAKMLGIKNRYSKMYEDEMSKYRVEIPELQEAEDEEVFEFLSNNGDDVNGKE